MSTDVLDTPDQSKRRVSRIPFLGRARKKSAPLHEAYVNDNPLPPLPSINVVPTASPQTPPRPSLHASNLGSRIAKRFTPSRSKSKAPAAAPPRASANMDLDSGSVSDTLAPPSSSIRASSFDSTASAAGRRSHSRSTTPRPLQLQPGPVITVSDSFSGYEDLFTRPRRKSAVRISDWEAARDGVQSEPESSSKGYFANLSPPQSPRLPPPPAPAPADEVRFSDTASIKSARSVRSTRSSRLSKGTSLRLPENPHKPPDIPLPATPGTPDTPGLDALSAPTQPRVRAQTLSAISINTRNSIQPQQSERKTVLFGEDAYELPVVEDLDIDSASSEELRHALRKRNYQLEELVGRFITVVQTHTAEKSFMEKKIVSLERDAVRREREIKGLSWLVKNRSGSSVNMNGSLTEIASKSMGSLVYTADEETERSYTPVSSRVSSGIGNPDDSGAETYSQASGTDSIYGGDDVASRRKSARRSRLEYPSASRASSRRSSGLDVPLPDLPKPSKRSAVSSGASATSLPASPSSPSLSAIPETPPPLPAKQPFRDPALAAAVQSVEQMRQKEERNKAGRSKKRLSAPDLVPSATQARTPAAEYAADLKREQL